MNELTIPLPPSSQEMELEGLASALEDTLSIGLVPEIDRVGASVRISVNDSEVASRYEGSMKDRLYYQYYKSEYPSLCEEWQEIMNVSGMSLLQFMQNNAESHEVVTNFSVVCEALATLFGYIIIDIERPAGEPKINAIQQGVGDLLHKCLYSDEYQVWSTQIYERRRMLSFLIMPKQSE
jgi:hypothetical protein